MGAHFWIGAYFPVNTVLLNLLLKGQSLRQHLGRGVQYRASPYLSTEQRKNVLMVSNSNQERTQHSAWGPLHWLQKLHREKVKHTPGRSSTSYPVELVLILGYCSHPFEYNRP